MVGPFGVARGERDDGGRFDGGTEGGASSYASIAPNAETAKNVGTSVMRARASRGR